MFTAKYMYIHHYKYMQVSLTLFTLHVYTNYMYMYRHLMFLLIRDSSFIQSYTLYNRQYREWKERLVRNINCLKFPKKVGGHNFNYCKVYNTNLSYNGINAWSCYIRTWTERLNHNFINTKTKFSDNLTSPLSGFVMHKTADSNFPLTLNFGTFCF